MKLIFPIFNGFQAWQSGSGVAALAVVAEDRLVGFIIPRVYY